MSISPATMRKAYKFALKKAKSRLDNDQRVRVGFGVVFDSVFPMASVCRLMQDDDMFDPFIFPIPYASKGKETERSQYLLTLDSLKKGFPEIRIVNPYDERSDAYRDLSDECDMYCTTNPYDPLTLPQFGIKFFWNRHIPVFYSNYGINIARSHQNFMETNPVYGLFWRIYADNEWCLKSLESNPSSPQVVLSGCPKMDMLASQEICARDRKRIIIGMHHSIMPGLCSINFGTFLDYADFYHELPRRYPQIDFVFRPHPILFSNLAREDIWGAEKAEGYWKSLESQPNAELQRSGEFYGTFASSDALIHDCGAFTAEYLYVGKPCCKVMPASVDIDAEYGDFGKVCLDLHYHAFKESDIISFIDQVVLQEKDPLKEKRAKAHEKIAVNYPDASEFIVKDIKTEIVECDLK